MDINELRGQRANYLARMQELADKRGLATDADIQEFDSLERDIKLIDVQMATAGGVTNDSTSTRSAAPTATAEDRAFTHYLRTGVESPELRAAGMSEGTGSQGGFTVPQSFWNKLAIALKLYGGMSQYFTQLPTEDGRVTPFPTNNPTAVVGSYITENTQVSQQQYVFGEGVLYGWTLTSGVVLASLQLMQDSAMETDSFVAARVGESIGRKLAVEAVSGAGPVSNAATGINTALNSYGALSGNAGGVLTLGSATAVKLFSGTTTELAANVLAPQTAFSMIAGVDPAYWEGAAFYMNATQALNERQVVDSNGRPLLNFNDGWSDGAIGTIGGFPVRIANEIPNLSASTLGGPIFANLEHAMVQRMVKGATVNTMKLTERYADFLQVGYIGWQRFDMQPVDLRAAVVVKAAST